MFVDKSLLIKGIAGVAAIGAGGTGFVYREEIKDLFKSKEQKDRKRINGILESLGLGEDCRLDETTDPSTFTKECGLDEGKLKKIKFSNKGEGELTVKSSSSFPADLKIKIEGNKEGIDFSFTGVTDSSPIKLFGDKKKGKIIVKGSETKFKVGKDGRLEKVSTSSDTKLKSQLEEFNKQLGSVNAPQECRFDESEGETTVECDVTPDELKKMVFSKDQGEVTYKEEGGGGDFTGMKLVLKTHEEITHSGHGTKGRVMYLTFKDYNKTVKLMKGNKEVVSFIKNTNPEFGIGEESDNSGIFLIEKMWGLNYIWPTLGLQNCTIQDGATQGQCNFNSVVKTIKVAKGTGGEFVELTVDDTNGNKFVLHKDVEGYNQGFKFEYSGTKVTAKGGSDVCLEPNSNYEFRWKIQNQNNNSTKIGYLVKK